MNEFTKGKWLTVEPNTGFVYCLDESGDRNQFQFCIQGNGRNGYDPKTLQKVVSMVEAAPDMYRALRDVQKIIAEAAAEGFNPHKGDWAQRLFDSNRSTSSALAKADGVV